MNSGGRTDMDGRKEGHEWPKGRKVMNGRKDMDRNKITRME